MPRKYDINCKICGKHTIGRGKFYCSISCREKDCDYRKRISKKNCISMKGKQNALGYKHTKEWAKKSKQWKIGNKSRTGQKSSIETRLKQSFAHRGEKAYNYKGEFSAMNARIRHQIEIRLWRESVFERDNWTCQRCKERGGDLCAHHIQNFAQFPELRFAINNGIIFCRKCHINFHNLYGKKNNNAEQIKEFIKMP